ncbi:hypothetical protein AJ80_09317 [Polytolypa hystricis UAMH7299]|uniref:Uncharacterized protein n=1 Tax=Polytolypa hystricis (strain UAMH7299) TaxID=1447883 RepID=A0A2B7WK03_POLH7|nr:hypothetical protein AJ80_09317 [Polytolypa hystricis UAMH7299]
MAQKSNYNRARARTACRKALSEHIWECLKIRVDPMDVRLIPGIDAPYAWNVPPPISQLFKTHLSKHSVGAYKTICGAVKDKSLQAILPEEACQDSPEQPADTISNERTKNERLAKDLELWKLQATHELEKRELAEETIKNLGRLNEEYQARVVQLEEEIKQWISVIKFFQQSSSEWLQRVTEALPSLQALQSSLFEVAQESPSEVDI